MEIEVIGVQDAGFVGEEGGNVMGAALAFRFNGEEKILKVYGKTATEVLKWKEGEKHVIEPSQTMNGKPSFRLPQAGGGFGGGGFSGGGKKFEPAYRNTEAGQKDEQAHMDARTALMQAVAFVGVETDIGGEKRMLGIANQMYDWLRSKNGG